MSILEIAGHSITHIQNDVGVDVSRSEEQLSSPNEGGSDCTTAVNSWPL
ncbi:MAG: hypothetical protein ACKVH8_23380 [Pirellulales bacterium]